MTKEPIITTVYGVELVLMDIGMSDGELWLARNAWDGPSAPATIAEWKKRIGEWRLAKQIEAGFDVWNLTDDRPKYWGKRQAVFRNGHDGGWIQNKRVLTRNSASDPDSLYGVDYTNCAMDTPEVAAAIDHARKMHAEAVEAGKRYKDAVRAIPRMTLDEWRKLPEPQSIKGDTV